jgi:uncharacterized membrane protein
MIHILNSWRTFKRVDKEDANLTEYWGMTIYDDSKDKVYNIKRKLEQEGKIK